MDQKTIVIASTFTAEPIQLPLRFWIEQLKIHSEVKFAPFNQVFQQLLDPLSLIRTNKRGLNLVLARSEDWIQAGPNDVKDEDQSRRRPDPQAARNVRELIVALKTAADSKPAPLLLCLCHPSPRVIADPELNAICEGMEKTIQSELSGIPGIHVVTACDLSSYYPVFPYYDEVANRLGSVPYTRCYFAALATMVARRMFVLDSPPFKVLTLDCDNTLWSGVCAEDGAQGIEVDVSRIRLQQLAIEQQAAGVLLCLVSKNNEVDVKGVFAARHDMALKLSHITSSRINWKPKSDNIRSLAAELKLGLESFIFLDDDPVVCEEVRANCPEVLTLQLPVRTDEIPSFLRRIWVFDQRYTSGEDTRRAELYRQNAERESIRTQFATLDSYLADLNVRIQISKIQDGQYARAAQLTQRTNQFNFTAIRQSQAEIRQLVECGGLECLVVEVSDRFGDYGLVGVMMFRLKSESIVVDSFLLSCRALGRKVEHRMLARLGEIARDRGTPAIHINFVDTGRNQPAREFLESVGLEFGDESPGSSPLVLTSSAAEKAELSGLSVRQAEFRAHPEFRAPAAGRSSDDRREMLSPLELGRLMTELADPVRVLKEVDLRRYRRRDTSIQSVSAGTDLFERELLQIWEDTLGISPLTRDDDFFALGGDSILAVSVFAELERVTGVMLPLTTLLSTSTVRGIADLVRQSEEPRGWPSLVPIQPDGSKPPLFCIHAGGGNVLFYRDLARRLGPDQPFYGLQLQGLDKRTPFHKTVEEMASHYIKEIRQLQPSGPYFLGGACFGGLVAFEMAHQLFAQGQAVALVALFDTNGPDYPKLLPATRLLRLQGAFKILRRLQQHAGTLLMLAPGSRSAYLLEKFKKAKNNAMRSYSRRMNAIRRWSFKAAGRAMPAHLKTTEFPILPAQRKYVPKLYAGKVTLFRATKQPLGIYRDPTMGWKKVVAGSLEVHNIQGYHGTIVVEPRVASLGEMLKRCIERAQLEVAGIGGAAASSSSNEPRIEIARGEHANHQDQALTPGRSASVAG
jgi:FkbH-like protein